jgi:hypothetical protein
VARGEHLKRDAAVDQGLELRREPQVAGGVAPVIKRLDADRVARDQPVVALQRREREDAIEAIDARLPHRLEQVHDHLTV